MSPLQKTSLHEAHLKLQAKMIDFAGWEMPLQYEGFRQEHQCVREAVGLFDVSHMGEIRLQGKGALETVEWVTTNYVAPLQPGQAQYTLMSNERGGIVDDLIVYCLEKGRDYLLCVNAINTQKDLAWVTKNNLGRTDAVDESFHWAQVAVQGPRALNLVAQIYPETDLFSLPSFHFLKFQREGGEHLVAKTGYTGEEGCEIFLPWNQAPQLWSALMEKGKPFGVKPIGAWSQGQPAHRDEIQSLRS